MSITLLDNAECPICMEHIKKEECCVLKCTHTFHTKCITNWAYTRADKKQQPRCPLCRDKCSFFKFHIYGYDQLQVISERHNEYVVAILGTLIEDIYNNWCIAHLMTINDHASITTLQIQKDASMFKKKLLTCFDPITQTSYEENIAERSKGMTKLLPKSFETSFKP